MIAAIVGAAAQTRQPGRVAAKTPTPAVPAFSVVEATIPEMRAALDEGRVTSRELVMQCLARIATYDRTLHAVMTVNANALAEADARDRDRRGGKVRGPLHGIPIALKDNIHTTDMPTTGGALAFEGLVPPYEATLTKNLRDAGAIIIAKTVLTELANWVAGGPTPMPGNYSALGGYGMNPYDPRTRPPRGDRRRPARAGDGRLELGDRHGGELLGGERRHGNLRVDPESREPEHARGDQADGRPHQPVRRHPDHRRPGHAGTDGEDGHRRRDHAGCAGGRGARSQRRGDEGLHRRRPVATTRSSCGATACEGARIGIPRAYFYDEVKVPGRERPSGGLTKEQAAVMEEAIAVLKAEGAVIVDPADIPSVVEPDASRNVLQWNTCSRQRRRRRARTPTARSSSSTG